MHDFLIISPVPLNEPRNPIDELVKASGLPACDVALKARLSPAALCRYRKGLRSPTATHALRLAGALGVTVETLMRRPA